jgi:FMN phosphatase YigB (HAD superfamily)
MYKKFAFLITVFLNIFAPGRIKFDVLCSFSDLEGHGDEDTTLIFDLGGTLVKSSGGLTEDGLAERIKDLSRRFKNIISITSKEPTESEGTRDELGKLGIKFDSLGLDYSGDAGKFSNGILSAGTVPKGKAFQGLLGHLEYNLKKVVYVDDEENNIIFMQTAARKHGIGFKGFWYRGNSDEET